MTVKFHDRYPVDFDVLERGDAIAIEQLESILGMRKDHRLFPLKTCSLGNLIERNLASRGKVVTCRVKNGALLVCDDEDMSEYNRKRHRQALRKAVRSHVQTAAVDVSRLSTEQRAMHEKDVCNQAKYVAAIAGVRKEIRMTAAKRITPGLPKPDGNGNGKTKN
jgi:hypothetical protein